MSKIAIDGYVDVILGDTTILHQVHNRITSAAVLGILSFIAMGGIQVIGTSTECMLTTYSWAITLGTDTITRTTKDMTKLVSPIGVGNGTGPSSKSVNFIDTYEVGYGVMYSGTWDMGLPNVNVGEIGLWLTLPKTTNWKWYQVGALNPGQSMASRLSVADGEMEEPFPISQTNPITVNWSLFFSFE
jgi:hypothetical protein